MQLYKLTGLISNWQPQAAWKCALYFLLVKLLWASIWIHLIFNGPFWLQWSNDWFAEKKTARTQNIRLERIVNRHLETKPLHIHILSPSYTSTFIYSQNKRPDEMKCENHLYARVQHINVILFMQLENISIYFYRHRRRFRFK